MCGTLNGTVFPSLTRVELQGPMRCTQVACGRKHILVLLEGGYVLSWGTGYLGQLGLGDDSSWDSPRPIRQLEPRKLGDVVSKVVCGGSHSGVITEQGRIYMWGLNRNGQTGTGIKAESLLEPRPVDTTDLGKKHPRDLVCGRNHTCLLTSEGRVFSWGAAGFGRWVKFSFHTTSNMTRTRKCLQLA
jgi:E3 ubiquitin-protein ligase HERC4